MTDDNELQELLEELEALADEWEEDAEIIEHGLMAGLLKHKVLELEELIAEYRSGADEC